MKNRFDTRNHISRFILVVVLLTAFLTVFTGCSKSEKTPEAPANAETSYNLSPTQGFNFAGSASVDTNEIKQQIADLQTQMGELQEKIKSRQNDLKALETAAGSAEITNLENQIKELQAQIAALQSRLKELQSAAQTEEITSLQNEIKDLQDQLGGLQRTASALQDQLNNPVTADDQGQIGHLEYLRIGSLELAPDFTVADPMSPSQKKAVAGVMSAIAWNGGYADPITFSCQVSGANKNQIATMLHSASNSTDVEFAFSVYDYDPKTKSYYKCFHTDSVRLKGLVQKSGGDLLMNIAMDQSTEVVSPKNYTFDLSVMPQDIQMQVELAVSSTAKFAKAWGVEVGV
ncbi:MAG: hypothetical protein ACM3QZ_01965 [Solirubrobacterales bacterium]